MKINISQLESEGYTITNSEAPNGDLLLEIQGNLPVSDKLRTELGSLCSDFGIERGETKDKVLGLILEAATTEAITRCSTGYYKD